MPSKRRFRALTAAVATIAVGLAAASYASSRQVVLPAPAPAVVQAAIGQACIDFARKSGGEGANGSIAQPISNVSENAGATLVLAIAAQHRNRRALAALRRQVLQVVDPARPCRSDAFRTGSSEPTAAGGVSAQDDLWVSAMFVVMRHTPAVWRALPQWERTRIDLIMRAELVSNAFATSDRNPYLATPGAQRTIDGGANVGRDWNPNYREGMLGQVLLGAAYFGDGATRELTSWNRAAFLAEVRRRRMTNLEATFSWGEHHPAAAVPSDAVVRASIRAWRYHGIALSRPMALYASLTTNTFALPVECGASSGQGVPTAAPPGVAGRLVDPAACAGLSDLGQLGMLREFDSHDGGGVRSSAGYAYMGFKANLATQIGLIVAGVWSANGSDAQRASLIAVKRVGTSDLFEKLHLGYVSYANGRVAVPAGNQASDPVQRLVPPGAYGNGYRYTASLWNDVVLRWRGLTAKGGGG